MNQFWNWYNHNYKLNLSIAFSLFILQVIHLYWLAAHVIAQRLFSQSFFELTSFWYYLILIVDYTEIPALLTTSLIYINELRKSYSLKNFIFLLLLASQLLHIFWITDEFVIEALSQSAHLALLPSWVAWIAIAIDYLEVPVIIDTTQRLIKALFRSDLKQASQILKEK